jgi:hypothetical protein
MQSATGLGLSLPDGKYYLGDGGYALTKHVLTPFHGVRYHLNEWSRNSRQPHNKEELFNLRHVQLRNHIERAFGMIKKRFPKLKYMQSWPYPTQVKLTGAAFMIHNRIKLCQHSEDEFDQIDCEDEEHSFDDEEEELLAHLTANSDAAQVRNVIATAMWAD